MTIGDFNEDGFIDFIMGNYSGTYGEQVFLNNGSGLFSATSQIFGTSDDTENIAVGDFNNDGHLDIMTNNYNSTGDKIYLGDGTGYFSFYTQFAANLGLNGLFRDIDNDGDLDIIRTSWGYVQVYKSNQSETSPNTPPSSSSSFEAIVSGNSVTLSWSNSIDAQDSPNSLTYDLIVGTTDGGTDIFGSKLGSQYGNQGNFGNCWHTFSKTLNNLPAGTYYAKVRTVDNGFMKSSYSTCSFIITQTGLLFAVITVPDTIANNTQPIEIPVITSSLDTADNIISYQFNLAYDNTKLQYSNSSLTRTIADGGIVVVNSSTPGQLIISYMTTTPLSGEGSILNLQFNPLQIGTSELTISDFLYNTDTITDTQNGIVTIIGDYGDIDTNSYVQAYDAALALQYSVGLDPLPLSDPTPWENWRVIVGDVDGTDTITANDASLILQHSAGLISTFPVEGSKALEDPIADITITQDNDELVFTSTGDLFGLNIYSTNGTAVTMNTPTVLDQNMLSAFNINGSTYNVRLCTAYSPTDNTEFMRIPFDCSANEQLTFNMIVNKNSTTMTFNVDCPLGINDIPEKTVNIYPNPTNDKIVIEGSQAGKIEIMNLQGQVIKKIDVSNEKTRIDISKLSGGVYTMKIKTNDGIVVKKLIKK